MKRGRQINTCFVCVLLASSLSLPACGFIGGGDDGDKERPFIENVKARVGNVRERFQDAKRRPCVEHDECFAKEHCHEGYCAPYSGRTTAEPRPDMGQ